MRLKEDSSSYKSSNIRRRLYRQSPVEIRGKSKKRKNTTKWCKGKIGVKHKYKPAKEVSFFSSYFVMSVCENCGKKDHLSRKYFKDNPPV